METIYKYELMLRVAQAITIPEGAKILSAKKQGNTLCLWVQCDTRKHMQQRTIVITITGDKFPCPIDELRFIDTVQDDMFVWHVFERISGGQNESEDGRLRAGLKPTCPHWQQDGDGINEWRRCCTNSSYTIPEGGEPSEFCPDCGGKVEVLDYDPNIESEAGQ